MDSPNKSMRLQDTSRSTQPSLDASSKMFSGKPYHANLNSQTMPFMIRHSGSLLPGGDGTSGRSDQHPKEERLRLQQHPPISSSRPTTPYQIYPGSQPHTPNNSAFQSIYSTPERLIATSRGTTPNTGTSWPSLEQLTPRAIKRKPSLLGRAVSKRQKGYESPSESSMQVEVQDWAGVNSNYTSSVLANGSSLYYQGPAEHNQLNSSGFSKYEAGESKGPASGLSFGPPLQIRFDQSGNSSLNITQLPQTRTVPANEFRNNNSQGDPTFGMPVVCPIPKSEDRRNFNLGGIFSDNFHNGLGQHYIAEGPQFNRAKTTAPDRLPAFRAGQAMNPKDSIFSSPPQAPESHQKGLRSPFQPRERLKNEHNTRLRRSYSEIIPGSIHSGERVQNAAPRTPRRQKISGDDAATPLRSQERKRAEIAMPADVESDQESTPMCEALRRHRPQHQNGLSLGPENPSYRVSDVLPKESVFNKERQTSDLTEPVQSRPTGFESAPPDIIDLVTPETMKPPRRSVPMKERITPARKPKQLNKKANPRTPKIPKAKTTLKKTSKKKAGKPVEEDPALIREKQAAELLIRREADGDRIIIDEALFGEADRESEQDKEKRIQEEARKEEERKAANLLRSQLKEAAEVAVEEKKRKLAEEEILRKEEEAREAERKRAKREIDRRLDEEVQRLLLEEKRIMAAEKIKADREKAERENAEREQQKRLDAEKAAAIQAQADELVRMKAKLEEAKKQASSLNFKRNVHSEKELLPKETGPNQDVNKDEEGSEEEDSLFVSQTAPGKKPAPTVLGSGKTAAQIFLSQVRENPGARRAETLQRTKELIEARYARKEIEKSPEPIAPGVELLGERLTSANIANKNALFTKPKPKPNSDSGLALSIENDLSCSEASTSVLEEAISIAPQSTANAELEVVPDPVPPSSARYAPRKTLRPAAIDFQEEIRLISQLRREQLELDAKKKKEVAKKERTDKQKAERRKKDAEKAAEKKKQQLIADALKKGITLSEDDLKAKIENFLAEKEKQYELRAEKRAQREKSQKSDGSLRVQTPTQAKAKQRNTVFGSNKDDDDEELTMEQLLRKKNEDARRQRKMANARERNSGFVNAAAKKTVEDLQSDSESDEDGIFEISPENGKIGKGRDAESECESDTDSDSDYNLFSSGRSTTSDNNTQTHSFNTTTTSSRHGRVRQPSSRLPIDFLNSPLTPNPSPTAPDSTVNVYRVIRERMKRGIRDDTVLIDLFGNLEEANKRVLEQVEKIRNSKLAFEAYHEEMHEGGLRWAQIVHNAAKEYATSIYVKRDTRMASTLAGYDSDWFKSNVLKTIYQVVLCKVTTQTALAQDTTDESEDTSTIPKWTSKNIAAYTNLEMANHEACEIMCQLLKPETPRLEWHEVYESAVRDLRAGLEVKNNAKECFTAEVDNSDREMAWVDWLHVDVFVEELPLKGPLN